MKLFLYGYLYRSRHSTFCSPKMFFRNRISEKSPEARPTFPTNFGSHALRQQRDIYRVVADEAYQ